MMAIKELRESAFRWAKENLVGQVVHHKDIKREIEINNAGIKHTLKGKNLNNNEEIDKNMALIRATYKIPELIENVNYVEFQADKKNRDNIKGVHILENSNENYALKIVIKDTTEKNYFYDLSIKKES